MAVNVDVVVVMAVHVDVVVVMSVHKQHGKKRILSVHNLFITK